MSVFPIWIMLSRLIHILATNFVVIWTDSSLIKICILYPFRKRWWRFSSRKNCLWEMATNERKKKFEIQCFPGDLRWINIAFPKCSYNIFFRMLWPYGNKSSIKGKKKDYLWSRGDMCVNNFNFSSPFSHRVNSFFMLLEFVKERAEKNVKSHEW